MSEKHDVRLCPTPPRTTWAAEWIWVPGRLGYSSRDSYAFFRKRFRASGELRIAIAADTRYELYIDGARVARGTATSNPAYKTFDTYVVPVEPGEHIAAVTVHHIGEVCATAMQSRPGLLAEISCCESTVVTDSTWRVVPAFCYSQDAETMMSHFGFYEVRDYRKAPVGWTGLSYDDSAWHEAEVVGECGCEPWVYLVSRDIPHLETRTINARILRRGVWQERQVEQMGYGVSVADDMSARGRVVSEDASVSLPIRLGVERNEFVVLDFGREVTGHVRLLLEGASSGSQVDIGYDELLDDRGLPNPRRTYVHFADRFCLHKGQREVEVFDARGFRYLLVDVSSVKGGVVIANAEVDERTYPIPATGTFRCSDDRLNKLYQIGLETTRLCMLDTYVDCPSRERVLWMDSYLEGLCSSYGMGITELWRRVLFLFAQNVCEVGELIGAVKGFAPTDKDPIVQTYMMYYVCSLADYVLHTNDLLAGDALFGLAMDQFRVLAKFTTADGLIDDKWPNWQFIDWSAMDYGGMSASVNAIYLVMHHKAARLARQLGKHSVADDLAKRYEKLVCVFQRTFWIPREGLFADAINNGDYSPVRSQLTNALAVWAGVVSGDEAREIIRRITDKTALLPVTPGDYRMLPDFKCQTGGIVPIGTPALGTVLALVMFDLGMDDEAVSYLIDAWSPLAINGTFAEHFEFDRNTSLCHGWSAAPTMLMARYVLGVRPVAPGWTAVKVEPHPGGLSWAEGSIPTSLGEIRVAWRMVGDKLKLETHLPEGIRSG